MRYKAYKVYDGYGSCRLVLGGAAMAYVADYPPGAKVPDEGTSIALHIRWERIPGGMTPKEAVAWNKAYPQSAQPTSRYR